MRENMKTFLDAIQNNEELKGKVIEIDKKGPKEQPGEQFENILLSQKNTGSH